MVAGAKSKRGLDLDCDVIGLDRVASMRAMDEKSSRPYRLQPFEGSANPVALIDAVEACRAGSGGARDNANKGANICFVGGIAKIGLDDPGTIVRAAVSGASSNAAAAVVAGSKVSTIMAAILRAAASPQERRITCAARLGAGLRAWRQLPCRAANGNGELAHHADNRGAQLDRLLDPGNPGVTQHKAGQQMPTSFCI